MIHITHLIHWLIHTDAGLAVRIIAGCAIFAMLAAVDLRKHGRSAMRWREYGLLATAVIAALCYGVMNDQITVAISPEYFMYGKELYKLIGDNPSLSQLRYEAAKVGLKATWSTGLIFGVALLIANNPHRDLPRLRNRQLVVFVPIILMITAICGIIGGWLGYHGFLTRLSPDFGDMIAANFFRPYRFMCTWGVHLGDYIGGVIGTIIATVLVVRRRLSARRVQQQL